MQLTNIDKLILYVISVFFSTMLLLESTKYGESIRDLLSTMTVFDFLMVTIITMCACLVIFEVTLKKKARVERAARVTKTLAFDEPSSELTFFVIEYLKAKGYHQIAIDQEVNFIAQTKESKNCAIKVLSPQNENITDEQIEKLAIFMQKQNYESGLFFGTLSEECSIEVANNYNIKIVSENNLMQFAKVFK